MSLYNDSDANHLEHLARHRAHWTPEKEAAFQEQLKRQRASEQPAPTFGITADELPY